MRIDAKPERRRSIGTWTANGREKIRRRILVPNGVIFLTAKRTAPDFSGVAGKGKP